MTPDARVETSITIARDHPAFAGHFPGQPVVPAVVLLAEALAAIELATGRAPHEWTVSGAKFLQPVGPGARLTIVHEQSRDGRRFEIRSGGTLVASGALMAKGSPS
jgi:3-hydroxymyristoyl/3-hydroxydecanoyl-(acyl carrier protein) dehydratase